MSEFRRVSVPGRAGSRRDTYVRISTTKVASFTVPSGYEEGDRGTWEWDGNGVIRLRFSPDGDLRASLASPNIRQMSAAAIIKTAGLRAGVYPARVEDGMIYFKANGEAWEED